MTQELFFDNFVLLYLSGLFFIMYAETHYSFKGIYSRLKKKEPEIIADAPTRVEPGSKIPVLILIKDAQLHPVFLEEIIIEITWNNQHVKKIFKYHKNIDERLWTDIIKIEIPIQHGELFLNVTFKLICRNKKLLVKNDNYKGLSHKPLKVKIPKTGLPKTKNWYYGEFHCHTNFTDDQVEFGAPLPVTKTMAEAIGLNFFCATDHSYDLDDHPENYLRKDPDLNKWQALWCEAKTLNRENDFVVVPGEEVSVGNHKNQNVHFLILNNPDFLPGDGDGAEKWFKNQPTASIAHTLKNSNSNSAAFAAHPAIKPPLLERLFIRRGKWEKPDLSHTGLHGLQIWNGNQEGFEEGKKQWIELLLSGKKVFISGGNDAHGNFNRFRQIGFPFLTMRENHHNIFGKIKTAVYLEEKLTLDSLLKAIKNGRMLITNGPFLDFKITSGSKSGRPGDTLKGNSFDLKVSCLSSPEFGELKELNIFWGDLQTKDEQLYKTIGEFKKAFEFDKIFSFYKPENPCYIRIELFSKSDEKEFKCLTNPIWIQG